MTNALAMTPNRDKKAPGKNFRPNMGGTLDTPLFHILVEPLLPLIRPVLSGIFAVRWQISRPLLVRVLPGWVPVVELPILQDLPYVTFGQMLLALPLIAIFLGCYFTTFISPDVEESGEYAAFAIYVTFLTANKSNSLFSFFLGIPFERMISLHNMASLTTVILSGFHGYVAYTYGDSSGDNADGGSQDRRLDSSDSQFAKTGATPNFRKFLFDGDTNMTGTVLFLALSTLVLTSLFPWIRRTFFDAWLWVHILSAICVIIFATMHEVVAILLVAGWWALDMITRYFILAGCRYPHEAHLRMVTEDVVEISFKKSIGFSYNAGQFVQFAIPALGSLAFHPISLASAPHEEYVRLYVRSLGSWSRKLTKLAKEKDNVNILIEGPYGSVSLDIDKHTRYQMSLFVSGGIGVTHCSSVAKNLLHETECGRRKQYLRFVWAAREAEMINCLGPLVVPPSDRSDLETDHHENETKKIQHNIFLTKHEAKNNLLHQSCFEVQIGRPDLHSIVEEVKADALKKGISHVAVFVCGPRQMISNVKNECRAQSQRLLECRNDVTFDVHEEIFEF